MCSLSAVQSHGSWPPFHGTDAMSEHVGATHHLLTMGLLSGLAKCPQKQEAAAGMCRAHPVLLVLAAALCATGP
ncbi:MAG: hypothetical protein ACPIOQ_10490 [Promethearchaeia archaeon]